MIQSHCLAAYINNGQVVFAEPAHDDPQVWANRLRSEALTSPRSQIEFGQANKIEWTVDVSNLGTAATAKWTHDGKARAVALVVSGVNDEADLKAVEEAKHAASAFYPPWQFDRLLWDQKRPLLMILSVDRRMYEHRFANTVDFGLATALFQKIGVSETKPPIKSKTTSTIKAGFHAMTLRSDGAVASRIQVSLESLSEHRPYVELMNTLVGYFKDGVQQIQLRADVGEVKLGIIWQALGKTAGVAAIHLPDREDDPESIALFLTGLDKEDDRAALNAYEKQLGVTRTAAIWSRNIGALGDDARPMAVQFLKDHAELPKIAHEIAWCVSAAFFQNRGVIRGVA